MKQFGKSNSLLQLINQKQYRILCDRWAIDKHVRSFSTWNQICVHVSAYLLRLQSFREIESVLFVPRSTFSDANRKRCSGFFQELCELVLFQIQSVTKDRNAKKAIKHLLAIDSSECKVHGSLASSSLWSQKNNKTDKKMASLKFHLIWNIDGEWVEDFRITPGNSIDANICKQFEIKPKYTYVFDRAYNHLDLWWKILNGGAHFISRLKNCPAREEHRERVLANSIGIDGVLWDGHWDRARKSRWRHPQVPKETLFRYIIYRDPETKKVFDFITSDFALNPQKVADIYKKRWAVELIFKWFKGHLNIRYFSSKNKNAIKIQLSIAVLVQLLLQLSKLLSKRVMTLWEYLREQRSKLIIKGFDGSHLQKSMALTYKFRDPFRSR